MAGDLYPVLEQYVPPRGSLVQEGQSQPALFVPRDQGDAPIERGWVDAERRTAVFRVVHPS